MPPSRQKPTHRRNRHPIQRIKRDTTYDAAEIGKLLGVHRNTVRQWLKSGLPTIDDRRPALVYGAVLRDFLIARQNQRRQSCPIGRFWCFRCRAPREAFGGMADAIMQSERAFRLSSLCASCETSVHRIVAAGDLPKIAQRLHVQVIGATSAPEARSADTAPRTHNCPRWRLSGPGCPRRGLRNAPS